MTPYSCARADELRICTDLPLDLRKRLPSFVINCRDLSVSCAMDVPSIPPDAIPEDSPGATRR